MLINRIHAILDRNRQRRPGLYHTRQHTRSTHYSTGTLTTDGEMALRHDDQLLSRNRIRLNRLRNDTLRQPLGIVVRRVPGVDALVVRALQQRERRFSVEAPWEPGGRPVGHGAEDRVRDAEAGGAEAGVRYFTGRHRVGKKGWLGSR